jgi:hypothetical protein
VFSPGEKVTTLSYDFENKTMQPLDVEEAIVERAKANALFASKAYKHDWYSSQ